MALLRRTTHTSLGTRRVALHWQCQAASASTLSCIKRCSNGCLMWVHRYILHPSHSPDSHHHPRGRMGSKYRGSRCELTNTARQARTIKPARPEPAVKFHIHRKQERAQWAPAYHMMTGSQRLMGGVELGQKVQGKEGARASGAHIMAKRRLLSFQTMKGWAAATLR